MSAQNMTVREAAQQIEAAVARVLPKIADDYDRIREELDHARRRQKDAEDAFNRLARAWVLAEGVHPSEEAFGERLRVVYEAYRGSPV